MTSTKRMGAYVFLSCVGLMLSGCMDDDAPVAPVVNAWYQTKAASNRYRVQSGDTIYSIAWVFGLDYRALASANHLNPPYILTPGQQLLMTTVPVNQPHHSLAPQKSVPSMIRKPAVARQTIGHTTLSTPWQWPVQGHVIQHYSTNPSGHPGISIAGQKGSPVRAAASGVVVYSGDGVRGYGNLIIVKHNDSFLSAYAFNERNEVAIGDRVYAGQVIARMGQNDAGQALLYFEIRRDGAPVDPLRYL